MKSNLNFKAIKDGQEFDMHSKAIWVESFHIYSPNVERNKLTVPGMHGSYLSSSRLQERKVFISLQIESDNMIEFDQLKHEIFELFYTDNSFSIIRDLTPGKEIFVMQEGEYDIENITGEDGGFSITLTMLDPFLYSSQETLYNFPSNGVLGFENTGTAESDSIITLNVLAPITYALIQNQDNEYMLIGKPIDLESTVPVEKFQSILNNTMGSTAGWTIGTEVNGGTVQGEIQALNGAFEPTSFGTPTSGWYGPALKTSLSEVLTDFKVEATVEFMNADSATLAGRLELYLVDDANNEVGKLALKDISDGRTFTHGQARVGDNTVNYSIINDEGSAPGQWNNFYGILRLLRAGNNWVAYIAKVNRTTGEHSARTYVTWTDAGDQFIRNLAQVRVHFGGIAGRTTPVMRIHQLTVEKINSLTAEQIPYIANNGDRLTIDTKKGEVLKNGEDITDEVDFGSDFFKIKPEFNSLIMHPNDKTNASMRYRKAWK